MISKDTKDLLKYTLGDKSHLNMFGKIIFFPFVILIFIEFCIFDILFTKKK